MATTWNPDDKSAGCTLSNGDLNATGTASPRYGTRSTTSRVTSGKYYFEILLVAQITDSMNIGIATSAEAINPWVAAATHASLTVTPYPGAGPGSAEAQGDDVFIGTMGALVTNDVVGFALDFAGTQKLTIYKNNVSQGYFDQLPTADGPLFIMAAVASFGNPDIVTVRPDALTQIYAPPSGFSPWDTGLVGQACL